MTLQPILDHLASIGCGQPEIRLLQPADPFLDTTGEDLRRRIFMTQDTGGASLCLRPEFTVPVCLHHLESGNRTARYAYGGTVFRQRREGPPEFLQAGFEDLGREDVQAADVDCIKVASDLLRALGETDVSLVIGHQAAFVAVLEALELPPALRKKLLRAFGDPWLLGETIAQLSGGLENGKRDYPQAVSAALENNDQPALVEAVSGLMLADGLPLGGGRTPEAIAHRLMEHHELGLVCLEAQKREVLESYLKLDLPLGGAAAALAELSKSSGLPLDLAIEPLDALASGLSGGVPEARFRASFGRRLDYYTGLVFEFHKGDDAKPLIGGGRYDRLLTLLGSKEVIPAVGFAVWVDRLGEAT